jgi:hypothetical protein
LLFRKFRIFSLLPSERCRYGHSITGQSPTSLTQEMSEMPQ